MDRRPDTKERPVGLPRKGLKIMTASINAGLCDSGPLTEERCMEILDSLEIAAAGSGSLHSKYCSTVNSMIDSIDLHPDADLDGGVSIALTIHVGKTREQTCLLYEAIREKAVSLIYGDWIFIPEITVGSSAEKGFPTLVETDLAVLDYIRQWRSVFSNSGPPRIHAGDLAERLLEWGRMGLVSRLSVQPLMTRCLKSGADLFDVCPGLCLKHSWRGNIARDLDSEGAFRDCVRERIREALDALGAVIS